MRNKIQKRIKVLTRTKADREIVLMSKKRFTDDEKRVDYILYYFREKFLLERKKRVKKYVVSNNLY